MPATFAISTAAVAAAALSAGLLAVAPAGAGAGATPPAAAARAVPIPTTLGQAGGTLAVCNGPVPAGITFDTAASGSPSYVAPTSGVVTSYSTVTNSKVGQVRAIVLGAGTTPDRLKVTAKSAKQLVTAAKTYTVPVQLRMQAGQRLALGWTVSGMACAVAGVAGDVSKGATPFDPDLTSDFVYSTTLADYRPNISAVLEPDVDNDGFGDVTQDACPQSALSQVACPPPDTTILKKPKRLTRHRIKIQFAATIAGSTFQCSLDGRRFHACKSTYKKRLAVGKHRLRVRAVSPAGIKDDRPAKVKFRIR